MRVTKHHLSGNMEGGVLREEKPLISCEISGFYGCGDRI